jgi:iron complex outermembrane receptor protein
LDQGFATLNLSSLIKIMSAVSKTSTNGYTLVNLGFGGKVTLGKKKQFSMLT